MGSTFRTALIAKGLCRDCGKHPFLPRTAYRCASCSEKNKQWAKRNRQYHRDHGICFRCGQPARQGQIHCDVCARKAVVLSTARQARYKKAVFDHYGRACACCGEVREAFLVMDHANGGGSLHRKIDPYVGTNVYRWLISNSFPDWFRVLCANCNHATRYGRICPHQVEAGST